jgi:hypothetical protein
MPELTMQLNCALTSITAAEFWDIFNSIEDCMGSVQDGSVTYYDNYAQMGQVWSDDEGNCLYFLED